MTLLCLAPGCFLPRHHTTKCTGTNAKGEECRGCEPALAEVGCVCERCYNRAMANLLDIAELRERLAAGWPDVVDSRTYEPGEHTDDCMDRMFAAVEAGFDAGLVDKLCRGCKPGPGPHRDPTSAGAPAGSVSRGGGPKVSGTPSRSAPVALDIVDLLAPDRPDWVHDQWRDQTGQPSVAAVLDSWARDWHTYLGHNLPEPTVPALVQWLRARLDWAVHNHPAVDDFIWETANLRARLYGVLHEQEPEPEHCIGVACRRCHERNLFRRTDGTGDIDCHSCGLILKASEYADYTYRIAASGKRTHTEAVALVRMRHAERDGCCPTCGVQTGIDEVALMHAAPGSWAEGVVRVKFDCCCEVLMTPAIA